MAALAGFKIRQNSYIQKSVHAVQKSSLLQIIKATTY